MRLVVLVCTLAVFLLFVSLLNGFGRMSDQMRQALCAGQKQRARLYG